MQAALRVPGYRTVPFNCVVRVPQRDRVHATLNGQGIGVGVHYPPNQLKPAFAQWRCDLPVTEQLGQEILSLPFHRADKWTGKPAHPAMAEAAAHHGYDLSGHRARQVDRDLMHGADTILAMDATNLTALHQLAAERTVGRLVLYLCDRDVPDPFDQPGSALHERIEMIVAGATRRVQRPDG